MNLVFRKLIQNHERSHKETSMSSQVPVHDGLDRNLTEVEGRAAGGRIISASVL